MLSRLYAVIAWIVVAIGVLHMVTTFRLPGGNSIGKIWFFGSGLAIALVGALNLLHRSYGAACFGVRFVCRTANILLLLLAIVAGILMHADRGQQFAIWSLLIVALILSCLPAWRYSARRAVAR